MEVGHLHWLLQLLQLAGRQHRHLPPPWAQTSRRRRRCRCRWSRWCCHHWRPRWRCWRQNRAAHAQRATFSRVLVTVNATSSPPGCRARAWRTASWFSPPTEAPWPAAAPPASPAAAVARCAPTPAPCGTHRRRRVARQRGGAPRQSWSPRVAALRVLAPGQGCGTWTGCGVGASQRTTSGQTRSHGAPSRCENRPCVGACDCGREHGECCDAGYRCCCRCRCRCHCRCRCRHCRVCGGCCESLSVVCAGDGDGGRRRACLGVLAVAETHPSCSYHWRRRRHCHCRCRCCCHCRCHRRHYRCCGHCQSRTSRTPSHSLCHCCGCLRAVGRWNLTSWVCHRWQLPTRPSASPIRPCAARQHAALRHLLPVSHHEPHIVVTTVHTRHSPQLCNAP